MLTMTSSKNVVNMLDLGKHVKKGYFPYNFTDLNYRGDIPSKSTFSTSKMTDAELNWGLARET